MAFKEKDWTFYAVSISFWLYSEWNSISDVFSKLHDATIWYLTMCINDNESKEEIYRWAKKEYLDMYNNTEGLDSADTVCHFRHYTKPIQAHK